MNQENTLIIVGSQPPSAEVLDESPLGLAIAEWLDNKYKRSKSDRTLRAYSDTLRSFRTFLLDRGMDMDSPGDLSDHLQAWSGQPGIKRNRKGQVVKQWEVTPATINHRLAVVSSFYRYAMRRKKVRGPNPAEMLEPSPVQDYAKAQPLSAKKVRTQLQDIDQTQLAGKRDFALLQVALNTGRRRAELAGLRCKHLQQEGDRVFIAWPRAKGDKAMHDLLDPRVSVALMDYLHAAYKADLAQLPQETPVWIALDRPHYGHALTTQAIANIVEAHLGTSKAHATRHTFAHEMENAGAKVSDIQARLGHASLQTTGDYLAALRSAFNPQSAALADVFFGGAEEE